MKQLCSSPSGSCIMISQCACAPAWGGGGSMIEQRVLVRTTPVPSLQSGGSPDLSTSDAVLTGFIIPSSRRWPRTAVA